VRVVSKKTPDDLFGGVRADLVSKKMFGERVEGIAVRAWNQIIAKPQNVERRHA
jgi:hypothetical protein